MSSRNRPRNGVDICAIFVHAGAGYHSQVNETIHLQACNDAAKSAMLLLRNGGSAVDAVEIAIKILEDREITNAGYGSNLAMDGVVECDASIVDHHGRSGAVGAVAQIKNPISLARCVLEHTMKPLTLRRVPPNLLVSQGATDFAFEQGIPVLPHDALVSPAARERWVRWQSDLRYAEKKARKEGAGAISAYKMKVDVTDPDYEEQVRKRMRQEHERKMLGSALDDLFSSAALSDTGKPESPCPSDSSTGTSWKTGSTPETPSSSKSCQSDHLESLGPPRTSIQESSSSAFINSTQKVPTLSSIPSMNQAGQIDTPMSDYNVPEGGSMCLPPRNRWSDGSSGEESESSRSSDTLQLPSLTPSPPPHIALETPLPDTPPEQQAESPSSRISTLLDHVGTSPPLPSSRGPSSQNEDHITDTVGAIAIDSNGNIACGASSGGIGMKYRGRVGPAALVGVGAAVIPIDAEDRYKTCVATVTSGTGEHMATTMAATVCAERLYHGVQRSKGGFYELVNDDDAVRYMIENEFMGHPSVKNSNSAGAIGILGVKKTREGVYLYFAHNTDSFALASMHSDEATPVCTMSRNSGSGTVAQGGRALRYRKKKHAETIHGW